MVRDSSRCRWRPPAYSWSDPRRRPRPGAPQSPPGVETPSAIRRRRCTWQGARQAHPCPQCCRLGPGVGRRCSARPGCTARTPVGNRATGQAPPTIASPPRPSGGGRSSRSTPTTPERRAGGGGRSLRGARRPSTGSTLDPVRGVEDGGRRGRRSIRGHGMIAVTARAAHDRVRCAPRSSLKIGVPGPAVRRSPRRNGAGRSGCRARPRARRWWDRSRSAGRTCRRSARWRRPGTRALSG